MADGKDVDTIQNEIHDMLIVILSDNNFADGDLVARAKKRLIAAGILTD